MHEINFDNKQHVHFTGIGGISMSGLAEILLSRGFTVSGSDSNESKLTRRLVKHGAKISYQQVASNITSDVDVVVYDLDCQDPEMRAEVEASVEALKTNLNEIEIL